MRRWSKVTSQTSAKSASGTTVANTEKNWFLLGTIPKDPSTKGFKVYHVIRIAGEDLPPSLSTRLHQTDSIGIKVSFHDSAGGPNVRLLGDSLFIKASAISEVSDKCERKSSKTEYVLWEETAAPVRCPACSHWLHTATSVPSFKPDSYTQEFSARLTLRPAATHTHGEPDQATQAGMKRSLSSDFYLRPERCDSGGKRRAMVFGSTTTDAGEK